MTPIKPYSYRRIKGLREKEWVVRVVRRGRGRTVGSGAQCLHGKKPGEAVLHILFPRLVCSEMEEHF